MIYKGDNLSELQSLVSRINEILDPGTQIHHFYVSNMVEDDLLIRGTADYTRGYDMELKFLGILFFQGDFEWQLDHQKLALEITDYAPKIDLSGHSNDRILFSWNTDLPLHQNPKPQIQIWAKGLEFKFPIQ